MLLSPAAVKALSDGAVLLTPNQRIARLLGAEYDRAQKAAGEGAWQPARILPWRAWTADLWSRLLMEGVESRPLLSSAQESALWELVYREGASQTLRSSRSIAAMCAEAYALLGAYDVNGTYARVPVAALSTDCAAYHDWHNRFQKLCRAESLLPSVDLDVALAAHLASGAVAGLPREILLYAMEERTPAQDRLLRELQQGAVSVTRLAPPERASTASARACADGYDEFTRCAAWARGMLERDPSANMLIVVPDLEQCRPALERALRNTLVPAQNNLLSTSRTVPYDFSIGTTLASVPLATDALRLLRWASGALPFEDVSALLISPYCPIAATVERGAELDVYLRNRRSTPTPAMRADALASALSKQSPEAAEALDQFQQRARSLVRNVHTYAEWADIARSLLREVGWPGTRERSSAEFQAVERWEELLDSLSSLDMLLPRCSWSDYLQALTQAATEIQFAPENTGAPVQVVTLREARGLQADGIWFLHASETGWSSRRNTHPFLPRLLQERCGMPGSSEQADEEAAQREALRLAGSAAEVCFSYAAQTPEGVQRPSPLLQAIPGLTPAAIETPVLEDDATDLVYMDELEDDEPLPMLPDVPSHGGSGVLVAQAACPFRAFAEFRLFSSAPEDVDAGLSRQERGTVIHHALQLFWAEVKTHEELLKRMRDVSPDGRSRRDETLAACLEKALPANSRAAWDITYLKLQRQRLQRLLGRWLDLEAARPPFTVVAMEAEKTARLGPLSLKIRIDRVDRVVHEDGPGSLLLDYKTGKCSVTGWGGERPDAPQLPLYAVAGEVDEVCGVAFAAIAPGEKGMAMRGVTIGPGILPEKPKHDHNLLDQLEGWSDTLMDLADGFASGDARVDPKTYPGACQYCAQRLLCRVNPDLIDVMDLEEETEA